MDSEKVIEDVTEYLEEISSSIDFPFSDGDLSYKAVGKGFDFKFNNQGGEPGAIIYGEVEEDAMTIRYRFEETYNEAKVENTDSAIAAINLALDHILSDMDYSGRDQYLGSKNTPTTVE